MLPRRSIPLRVRNYQRGQEFGRGKYGDAESAAGSVPNMLTGVAFEGVAQVPLNCRGAALRPTPTHLNV
jgi:hypothetical protein